MAIPSGPTTALFTLAELDAWVQATVSPATGALILQLVSTVIRNEIGADRYDALTDLSPLKLIALDLARRMQRNSDGRRSTSEQIDDYTTTVTYATETLQLPDLTADDIDSIWRAMGVRRTGAFTIRPSYLPTRRWS